MVISSTFSLPPSSFSTIISVLLPLSDKSTKRFRVVGEDLGRQRDSLLGVDNAVGPNLQRQLVIVDALPTRVLSTLKLTLSTGV